ncbi:transposase [Roseateles sp. GG27B]
MRARVPAFRVARTERHAASPERCDANDYDCPKEPQTVRLIRHVAPNGAVRILMTNLMDSARFPASAFGALYYQRWRIEESFRIKRRLGLEHVTGLSQHAVEQDVAAKILCDNLQAMTAAAHADANLADSARINHAYVHTTLKPLLPALLLGKSVAKLLQSVLSLIARETHIHKEGQGDCTKLSHKSSEIVI